MAQIFDVILAKGGNDIREQGMTSQIRATQQRPQMLAMTIPVVMQQRSLTTKIIN
nr:hypothetical protein [Rickettsia endosymbiont of Ceutorhynchus assimilis]